MMEGISSLVAVVPVIAKADTHTADELQAYREEILQVRPLYPSRATPSW
jgi:septin family protein